MQNRDDHLTEIMLGEEQVFAGRLLDVRVRTVRLPSGEASTREVILHKGAAAVVAVDAGNRVALVRQFRCAMDAVLLEIPAGKKDSAEEDPLDCAVRELREETGLTAASMRLLTHMLPAVGYSSEIISLYLATGLTQGETARDEDEFLDVVWMLLDEALAMVKDGRIADSKTALGLLLAESALREGGKPHKGKSGCEI